MIISSVSAEKPLWRKSTLSFSNGACAEVAVLPSDWRKSNFSNSQGACVEAGSSQHFVGVRDTTEETHPYRVTLMFPAAAWREFTGSLKAQVTGE